jgi:uncharacterized protein YegP (UPF0339 family)
MAGKFVITKNKKGMYHFNLIAQNGKIIATSEMYPDKKSAETGIASVIKNAPTAKIVDDTGEDAAAKAKAAKAVAAAKTEIAKKTKAAETPKKTRAKKSIDDTILETPAPKKRGRKPKAAE